MEIVEKIKQAKADTMMRVNNVIYAKISDTENSKWRSAFGEMYANAIINMVRQAKSAEFLTKEPLTEQVKPTKRKFVAEDYNVEKADTD